MADDEILTAAIGFAGVVVGALVTGGASLIRDWRLRKRAAQYLAVRVVCVLDPFVDQCCDVALDGGAKDQQGVKRAKVEVPTIEFPQEVDWKTIEPELMYRVLSIPNELDLADQYIRFLADEVAYPPDYEEVFAARWARYGSIGLAALALADEIRTAYGIPQRILQNWSPKEILEEAVAKGKAEEKSSGGVKEIVE